MRIRNEVLESKLSNNAKVVYMVSGTYANVKTQICNPHIATLANVLNLSRNHIKRGLDELVGGNVILKRERFEGRTQLARASALSASSSASFI